MNTKLTVSKSIQINGSSSEVWDALTNPEKIKIYLFGTETITDWKAGSAIVFQGEYQGTQYKDKGNVLENEPNRLLKYNYWSGFSGLEDIPENYAIVLYEIATSGRQLTLTWTQTGFASEQGMQHTDQALPGMLEQIKAMIEKK